MDISLWNFYTRLASKYGWRKIGNTGVRYKKGTSYITIEELGVPFVKVTTTLNHPMRQYANKLLRIGRIIKQKIKTSM